MAFIPGDFNFKLPTQNDKEPEILEERYPEAATMVDEAKEEILAFAAFPQALWQRIWSNNPLERLNLEIRRLGGCSKFLSGYYTPRAE